MPKAPAQLPLRFHQRHPLAREELAAAAFPGERGECLREVEPALDRAIGRLVPPDRHQDFPRHSIVSLDRAQRPRPACAHVTPTADTRGIDMRGDIGRERGIARPARRTGLATIERDHPVAGFEPRGHPRERRVADALGPRAGDQNLEVAVEIQAGLGGHGDSGEGQGQSPECGEEASKIHGLIVAEASLTASVIRLVPCISHRRSRKNVTSPDEMPS